eukprot:scaffold6152_cov99-Isochrysis_galbana.AAC.5
MGTPNMLKPGVSVSFHRIFSSPPQTVGAFPQATSKQHEEQSAAPTIGQLENRSEADARLGCYYC